jgi:hypothetical protein
MALGFAAVRDEVFRALVLGRIVEPTSKLDTVRVLGGLGVDPPSRVTFMRCRNRLVQRDYRTPFSEACFRHATRTGGLGLASKTLPPLLRDPREAKVRKVGMSRNA